MNKYFIYCRKSSEQEDRQVLSLESQEKELLELAKGENLEIAGIYKESGSAHVIGRDDFNEMIYRIENGEANGLIVWDESRIARNSLDGGKVIYMMDLGQITEIYKPGKIYKNTPDDKSWLSMVFMMSKKESDDKGVNVRRGLKTKAEKGHLPSGAKPGYLNDKYAEKGNKTLLKDPIRFPLIRKAWDLMLTGVYNPPKVLDVLNKQWEYRTPKHRKIGGKPMTRSMIYKVFADPFYYGEFEYPVKSGNWYRGKYEFMISKEEFDRVQMLMGRKVRPKLRTCNFFATGLIRCAECGASITAEEKWQLICPVCKNKFASLNKTACPKCNTLITEMVKPTLLHYIYYHCTKRKNPNCTQGWIEEKELNKQIEECLSKIEISEDFKNWAIKYLNEMNSNEVEDRNAVLGSIQEAYNDVVKRIDNLVRLKISPQNTNGELLSDDEFKNQKNSLMKEKSDLEEKLKASGERINKWVELSEKTFNFACYAKYWFSNGNLQTKRQILQSLGQNLTLKDKIVHIELEKPLQFIQEARQEVVEISPMLEPKKSAYNTIQLESLYSQNPSVLAGWDDFRTYNWLDIINSPEVIIRQSQQLLNLCTGSPLPKTDCLLFF